MDKAEGGNRVVGALSGPANGGGGLAGIGKELGMSGGMGGGANGRGLMGETIIQVEDCQPL